MTEFFGRTPDGDQVLRHELRAGSITAAVLTYGCVVQSLCVPDARGRPGEVTIGLDTLEEYRTRSRYFGAVVGRYGNRIADGRFTLDGRTHELPRNHGTSSLHGGPEGFSSRLWEIAEADEDRVVLTRTSPDGEAGYPGTLTARVTYTLLAEDPPPGTPWGAGALRIDYHAVTDAPTHVNLTNHAYFNLAGAGPAAGLHGIHGIHDHTVTLYASRYLPVDARLIPLAEAPTPVSGTPFDFTAPRRVGDGLTADHPQLRTAGGYDHCWVVDGRPGALRPAARVAEPVSGRVLDVRTTEPGVQFYSGNMLSDTVYGPGSGLCLETQHFPDSPNRPEFPSTVLRPGQEYTSTTVYRFTTESGDRS
ncbi:aldose epimerase family protein [Streptomyces sp. JJ36]|uniref:aldose epimerase family protein n=1 Tax=Streptomyces sp. JJ36 TaxID=2736645 RepID=UPI001F3F8E93|nr:aldose epimerase family protein [Streptomyces sp. JJ36]MCF6523953.1 galactose mutarotase [Streptomyces sp. JJ36]